MNGHAGAIRISADQWMESVELAREHHDEILEANGLRGLAVAWLDTGNSSEAEPLLRR